MDQFTNLMTTELFKIGDASFPFWALLVVAIGLIVIIAVCGGCATAKHNKKMKAQAAENAEAEQAAAEQAAQE